MNILGIRYTNEYLKTVFFVKIKRRNASFLICSVDYDQKKPEFVRFVRQETRSKKAGKEAFSGTGAAIAGSFLEITEKFPKNRQNNSGVITSLGNKPFENLNKTNERFANCLRSTKHRKNITDQDRCT